MLLDLVFVQREPFALNGRDALRLLLGDGFPLEL